MSLDRFLEAQAPVWEAALAELRRGAKRGHWMWFVLPQLAGLGRSETARRYAVRDLNEARAYLRHPVLGRRLGEACDALLAAPGSADAILGPVDAVKLRSCATLFAAAARAEDLDDARFAGLLDRFFGGVRDAGTVRLLER